ncbi:hypothetical protein HK101_003135, partial [Irineochytrium annulatum]
SATAAARHVYEGSHTHPRSTDGESGALCIHTALLPNGKFLCVERPHEYPVSILILRTHVCLWYLGADLSPPKFPWQHAPTDTYNYTGSEITVDEAGGSISMVTKALQYNAFCSGHSQAADGSIWMIGGDPREFIDDNNNTIMADGLTVKRNYALNDNSPAGTGTWSEGTMAGGPGVMTSQRWYPTVATLYDESIIIVSGERANIDLTASLDPAKSQAYAAANGNPSIEFHNVPTTDTTRTVGVNITLDILHLMHPYVLYPPVFQLPTSEVFMIVNNWVGLLDIHKANAAPRVIQELPGMNQGYAPFIYPFSANAFLLPMKESDNYTATVMICGGSTATTQGNTSVPALGGDLENSSADCFSMRNPSDKAAVWKKMAPMPNPRVMLDSVLLPDGTVLMTNGAYKGRAGGYGGQCVYATSPVFKTDLYDPVTNSWSSVGTSTQIRLYHSGAVLTASGRVMTMGSEMDNLKDCFGADFGTNALLPAASSNTACYPGSLNGTLNPAGVVCTNPYNYKFEMFTPAYLLNNPQRPTITSYPTDTSIAHGSLIMLAFDPAVPVQRVSLMRYTTTTHNTNTDQRHLEPTVLCNNGSAVWFKLPPNGMVAPPGNYHLFALTAGGVPSIAVRVNIRASGSNIALTPPTNCQAAGAGGSGTAVVTAASATTPTSTKTNAAAGGRRVVEGVVAAVAVVAAGLVGL